MWFNKLDKQLNSEIDALGRELNLLKIKNDNLSRKVEEYEARLVGEYSKASYAVDWSTMNAFSIERMREGDVNKTIIGYMLAEPVVTTEDNVTYKDVVREWALYCSHDEHQRLVKEFEAWRVTKC